MPHPATRGLLSLHRRPFIATTSSAGASYGGRLAEGCGLDGLSIKVFQGIHEALLPEIHGDALELIQKVFLFSALSVSLMRSIKGLAPRDSGPTGTRPPSRGQQIGVQELVGWYA